MTISILRPPYQNTVGEQFRDNHGVAGTRRDIGQGRMEFGVGLMEI